MKEGYKETELGWIPQEWELKTIGELFDFKNGLNKEKEYFGKGTKIVNYVDVYKNRYIDNSNINGFVTVTEKEKDSFNTRKGDVFFTRTSETINEIGMTAVLGEDIKDLVYSGFVLRARSKTDELSLGYKKYCFSDFYARREIIRKSSYTTRALTSGTLLKDVLIKVPPLKEQEKIADILSTVDSQIDDTDKLIEKTKELKKGLMQRLLTNGIGHTEFKNTEVGNIPVEWEVKTISEIGKFMGGYAFKSCDYEKSGIPLVKIANVQQNRLCWDEKYYLPKEYINQYENYSLEKGDIVMAMTRPVISSGLKVCRIKESDLPCLLNQRVGKFVLSKEIEKDFLFHYMFTSYFIDKIKNLCSTTGQPNISSAQVETILIPVPNIIEQSKISGILSRIDIQIEEYEDKKIKLEELKKGLMQQLLTGKIRVKI